MTDDDALIARLRSDLLLMAAKAQDMEANWSRCSKSCAKMQDHIDALTAERDALRKIAIELRSNVCCEHLHHKKSEQHSGTDCPVEKRIDAAIRAWDKP